MKYRLLFVVALLGAAAALIVPGVSAQAYPPTTCPMLSVSTTTPQAGQPMRVDGSHFRPLAHVTIALDTQSDVLAHVTTNSLGKFSTRVTLPVNKPGRHSLKAFGG